MSRYDRDVLGCLRRPSSASLERLFLLLQRETQGASFFRSLRDYLQQLRPSNGQMHLALVDLVLKLIFLMFVQRKGWLNFDPFYLETHMARCRVRSLSIVQAFLKPLFARLEGVRVAEAFSLGCLPRLGGGLFRFHPEALPAIPNDWCTALMDMLATQYSFSLFEARAERRIAGISPEVLGAVFENLLVERDRKAQGTFYTPGHLAEKQVEAGFAAWLAMRPEMSDPGSRLEVLKAVRVLDPSCGSGTYLVAAFQVLLRHRLDLAPQDQRYNGKLYALKRDIVTRNLYGIDINPMAVRLTEVRLWLNMIQDLEVSEPSAAPVLPNLQHHLRPGDFLNAHLPVAPEVLKKWPKYGQLARLRASFPASDGLQRTARLRHIHRLEQELAGFLVGCRHRDARRRMRTRLDQKSLPGLEPGARRRVPKPVPEPEKSLHVVFSDAMLAGGFDLIFGNPPWVAAGKLQTPDKQAMVARLPCPPGLSLEGQTDASLYFAAACLGLLGPRGHLGFLLPSKMLQAKYGAGLRAYLQDRCRIEYLFDYGLDQGVVFRADTFPLALGVSRCGAEAGHRIAVELHEKASTRSFSLPQRELGDRFGMWHLEPEAREGFCRRSHWPTLGELGFRARRGIVTGAKRLFTFERPPAMVPRDRLRPLLRGRDIQTDRVAPGAWIYWPFEAEILGRDMSETERRWLKGISKARIEGRRVGLPYGARSLGGWLLVWKYLASRWTPALIRGGSWIPDQTAYYVQIKRFEPAYRLFLYACSVTADQDLRAMAERGKDRCFFFYAHTCDRLPIPPDWDTRPLSIPEPRDLWCAAQGVDQWPLT
ncbi:Eco57I restriction-modification methylase domain-containing protein [Sulfidibacter corallicola]|uniref:site-specific DNA-methyltransferase (adenine-specific) n=1 Tax=Sulfidibacter corallicola TaxID=2818388 RepID=A0A8A4TUT2_SULCO|nr:DNA methyltransferase [Sulfidibacter corallicola]QTD53117.1 N-6 DNA methylase [Sulfidibacter corallicola]